MTETYLYIIYIGIPLVFYIGAVLLPRRPFSAGLIGAGFALAVISVFLSSQVTLELLEKKGPQDLENTNDWLANIRPGFDFMDTYFIGIFFILLSIGLFLAGLVQSWRIFWAGEQTAKRYYPAGTIVIGLLWAGFLILLSWGGNILPRFGG